MPRPSFSRTWSFGLFSPPRHHSLLSPLGRRRGAGPRNGVCMSAVSRLGPVGCAGEAGGGCAVRRADAPVRHHSCIPNACVGPARPSAGVFPLLICLLSV